MKLSRRGWLVLAGVVAVVVAVVAGIIVIVRDDGQGGAQQTLRRFVAKWEDRQLDRVNYVDRNGAERRGADVAKEYRTLTGDLANLKPTLRAGGVSEDGDTASARVEVQWTLSPSAQWRYRTTVRLAQHDGDWAVQWQPATIHPELTADDGLVVSYKQGERGRILDGSGSAMVEPRPVVHVGVVPREATDPDALAQQLGAALASDGVDTADLPQRIRGAQPDQLVEVVTLRKERYDQLRGQLASLPGMRFTDDEMALAPSRSFARGVLGTVGPVTKEIRDKNPGKYGLSDRVGLGGLQGAYEDHLAGSAGITVSTVKEKELASFDGKPGAALQTTVDTATQQAAEAAMAGEANKSALVAIRVSDGAILAAANGPDAAAVNLAFEASVAPGSTFKMVSGLGILDAGVRPDEIVNCPQRATVEGKSFKNDNDFELGDVPFQTDFARSCNTAFVGLAPKLGTDGLAKSAESLGIGRDWSVGIDANTGSVAKGGTEVQRAAAVFGQGDTTVSPLGMAGAVAAVARGQWTQPVLVRDPAGKTADAGPTLNENSVTSLRSMMRSVVTEGTATDLASVPGAPVHGKTGTAEYGDNQHSHGWFIGYQGDIAFAVFVENGESSAPAVKITKQFLTALAR